MPVPPWMPGTGRQSGLGGAAMHPGDAMGDHGLNGFGVGRHGNPFAPGAWHGNNAMVGAHMPGPGAGMGHGAGMGLGVDHDAMNRLV